MVVAAAEIAVAARGASERHRWLRARHFQTDYTASIGESDPAIWASKSWHRLARVRQDSLNQAQSIIPAFLLSTTTSAVGTVRYV